MAFRKLVAVFLCATATASPIDTLDLLSSRSGKSASQFPFDKIVAFGDDFTDDGSGSYAHGITGNEKTGAGAHMWGANTFTDGPVAVSYLSRQLNIPISYNYAWGSSGGAGVIGSICSNAAIPSSYSGSHAQYQGSLVPSALDQVNNYTTNGDFTNDIKKTLHFFWTGNNDMIASLGWTGRFTICDKDTLCVPSQQKFISELIGCFNTGLRNLVDAGAEHILVPSVYPRNLAPWTSLWISKEEGMIQNFGTVIHEFNKRLKGSIDNINAERGTNIMFYPMHHWMVRAIKNPSIVSGAQYTHTCADGCTVQNPTGVSNWKLYWNKKVLQHKSDPFYWMTEVVPSTTVFKSAAEHMFNFLQNRFQHKH